MTGTAAKAVVETRTVAIKLPINVWKALQIYVVLGDKTLAGITALALHRFFEGLPDCPPQVRQILRDGK